MSKREIRVLLGGMMQHEAWITRDWEDEGMSWVIVACEREAGVVSVGGFLVDAWCLGVKDAYVDEMTRTEFEALLDEQIPSETRESLEPACAKKLIEGAVAYAQRFGFLPQRDFRKARKVLNGIDAAGCAREFAFGCEGQPRFVIGPDDDDARVNRVIAVLTAKLGPEGFVVEEFEDEAADDDDADDDDADWDALDEMFRFVESAHCPDRSLNGFFVQGFVAGALLVDPVRECDEWWRELFGGNAPELPDDEEFAAEEILDGFLVLRDDTEAGFAADDFTPSLPPLDQPDHFSAAADFCRGCLRVIDADGRALALITAAPAAAAQLAFLRRVSDASGEAKVASVVVGRRELAPLIDSALRILFDATSARRATSGGALDI